MKMMGLSLVILLLGAAPPLASAAPGKRPKKVKKLKKPDQGWKQYVRYQKRAYLGVQLLPLTQELCSFFQDTRGRRGAGEPRRRGLPGP